MTTIAIVSMKGGVGKTSVTANLAAALAEKCEPGRVFAVNLDPQNGLQWHFGVHEHAQPGVCEQSVNMASWKAAVRSSSFGVKCLAYGDVDEDLREDFEQLLGEQPRWLAHQLSHADMDEGAVVLLDTPPGPSVYLKQALACADLVLVVLLADAGSYATIPAMETWLDESTGQRPEQKAFYLLNQIDRGDALNRDTAAFLRQHIKPRLCPVVIHQDESVAEALAFQQPVLAYEPHGQASVDVNRLADWVFQVFGA